MTPTLSLGHPEALAETTARSPGTARALAIESDHTEAAATAALPRDRGRTFDGARRLQTGVERDPQQAHSCFWTPLNAYASL
jgi:hypothetical protein